MKTLCQKHFDKRLVSIDGDAPIQVENFMKARGWGVIYLHNRAMKCIVSWQQFHTHKDYFTLELEGPPMNVENLKVVIGSKGEGHPNSNYNRPWRHKETRKAK